MNKSKNFNALYDGIKNCCKCNLCKTRNLAVPGEGNINSKIVFVGEAPGRNEDSTGRPFVGQAGKFLTELLENIKIKRDSVYITNIVKCRPPGNRNPGENEIEACLPYLRSQIVFINPKIICTLGNFAFKSMVKSFMPVSKAHGKFFKKGKFVFFCSYHPAAAIYNPKLKLIIKNDFKKLGEGIESKNYIS